LIDWFIISYDSANEQKQTKSYSAISKPTVRK